MKLPDFRRYVTLNILAYLTLYFVWFTFFAYASCSFGECTGLFYTKTKVNDIFFIILFIMPVFWLLFPIEVLIKFLVNKFFIKNKKFIFNFPKNNFFTFLSVVYNISFTAGMFLSTLFLLFYLYIIFTTFVAL